MEKFGGMNYMSYICGEKVLKKVFLFIESLLKTLVIQQRLWQFK